MRGEGSEFKPCKLPFAHREHAAPRGGSRSGKAHATAVRAADRGTSGGATGAGVGRLRQPAGGPSAVDSTGPVVRTKSGRERRVPLTDELVPPSRRTGTFRRSWFLQGRRIAGYLASAAHHPQVGVQAGGSSSAPVARHAPLFGSQLAMARVLLRQIQVWLSRSSIVTTQRGWGQDSNMLRGARKKLRCGATFAEFPSDLVRLEGLWLPRLVPVGAG
jgi:hypothetical protein